MERFVILNDDFEKLSLPAIIPRKLHMVWVGIVPIPDFVYQNRETWKKLLPGTWKVKLWKNKDISTFDFPQEIINRINIAVKGAQKADIMRIFIVEKYGGVYMDCDMTPNRSLESILSTGYNVILCHERNITWNYIMNAFFAAVPHHKLLIEACKLCYEAKLNTDDIHVWTGPCLLGTAAWNTQNCEKLYVLPIKYFYNDGTCNERFAKHEYMKMW